MLEKLIKIAPFLETYQHNFKLAFYTFDRMLNNKFQDNYKTD